MCIYRCGNYNTSVFFCPFLVRFARDVAIRDPLVACLLRIYVCLCVCRVCMRVCISWIAQSPIRVQKKSTARETRHARLNYIFRLLLLMLLRTECGFIFVIYEAEHTFAY